MIFISSSSFHFCSYRRVISNEKYTDMPSLEFCRSSYCVVIDNSRITDVVDTCITPKKHTLLVQKTFFDCLLEFKSRLLFLKTFFSQILNNTLNTLYKAN